MCNAFSRTLGTTFIVLWLSAAAFAETAGVPAYVLKLPDTVQDVFVADTGASTMYRFERIGDALVQAGEDYISIGQKGVGKERAWDRRTPLGIYFVVDQLDTERMHDKYGITAFPLDYPNEWDRLNRRTGDGIWVHGVLPGGERRPPFDTDGCIALPNEDLARLEERFVPLVTPVIVTRAVEWADPEQVGRLRDGLLAALENWSGSVQSGDLHAYLSMYANDFSYRGMTLGNWAALRFRNFEERGPVDIVLSDILIMADPEEQGLYLSRFRQSLGGRETTKRLYWRQDMTGDWKIVAEDSG